MSPNTAAAPVDSDDATNSTTSHGERQKSMETMSESRSPVYVMTPTAHAPPATQHSQPTDRGTRRRTSIVAASAPDTSVSSATSHAPADMTD